MSAVPPIIVGQRHRRDLGDIAALAASIDEVGLLHPVVVTPDGQLIAGARRLLAWERTRHAGRPIPRTVVDLDAIVRGELAENTERKDFAPSEIAAIAAALRPLEDAAAKARRAATQLVGSGKFPQPGTVKNAGESRDKLAAYAGVSGRTLNKIEAVTAAAVAEPERFGRLAADMDRTGRVDGPFKRLKVARQAEAIRAEPPPLPGNGPYRVIVADPPWPYELRQADPSHRGVLPYPSMSIGDICALPVAGIVHDHCVLWLWTTNHHMREAFTVLDAWGFQQKTILTWAKDRMGMGDWLRGQTEHCLMAVRGKPTVQLGNHTTLLHSAVSAHSRKPEEFYAFVEGLCPAPRYAEMFSRHARPGWDGHGDESGRR